MLVKMTQDRTTKIKKFFSDDLMRNSFVGFLIEKCDSAIVDFLEKELMFGNNMVVNTRKMDHNIYTTKSQKSI